MKIFFNNKSEKEKLELLGNVYAFINQCSLHNKNIEIIEIEDKKTYPQLRAIYKLLDLCLPHIQDKFPSELWNIEKVKEYVKMELGYVREPTKFEISMMIRQSGYTPKSEEEKKRMINFCKKIKQNISFAEFTKEQTTEFIAKLQVWAQEQQWNNVFLST